MASKGWTVPEGVDQKRFPSKVGRVTYVPRQLRTELVDARDLDELERYQWYSSIALALASAWWPLCITVDRFKSELGYGGGAILVLATAFFLARRVSLRAKMRRDLVACNAEDVDKLFSNAVADETTFRGSGQGAPPSKRAVARTTKARKLG